MQMIGVRVILCNFVADNHTLQRPDGNVEYRRYDYSYVYEIL